MLSLLKKKSDNAAPPASWHPNLRLADRLPDTKVVRTAFFINGAAVTVAIALALYLGQQEWQIRGLNIQIAEWQRQIDKDKSVSNQAMLLFSKFKAEAAKTEEVAAFVKSKPVVSAIILRIGQTLPNKIAMDGLDCRDNGVAFRGTVRGAPDQASGDASAYLDQLRRDKVLSALFNDATLTSLTRNPASGRVMVEIFLDYRKKEAKKP